MAVALGLFGSLMPLSRYPALFFPSAQKALSLQYSPHLCWETEGWVLVRQPISSMLASACP